jgi:hypothetical protein
MVKQDKRTWSSEHRCNNTMVMSADERHKANMNAREISIGLLAQFTDTESLEDEADAKKEDAKKAATKEKEEKKEEKSPDKDIVDDCEGCFPDIEYPPAPEYPTAPVLEKQVPDDHPCAVDEHQPPEDIWLCGHCGNSACSFLQWQEELERIVDIMYPEVTNKQKRYHMHYTGYKPDPFESGPRGDRDRGGDDGSTYY